MSAFWKREVLSVSAFFTYLGVVVIYRTWICAALALIAYLITLVVIYKDE